MKRSVFLLIGILLFAAMGCGGSGTTTSGIPGGGAGDGTGGIVDTATGPVGYITISMLSPDGPAANVPVTAGGQATINALRDHFRVVVKQVVDVQYLDEEGNPFIARTELRRIVQDNTIPGSVQIAVPPGDGYTVEMLTYDQAGSINNMLQYGQSGTFTVASGQTASVSLTLNPVSQYITMTAPDNVVTGFSYSVSISKTVPLRSLYYLSQTDNTASWPIANSVAGYGTGIQRTAASVSFTAPAVTALSNVYLLGQFFIDDSLLSASELLPATPPTWSNWRINCPNPVYTQEVKSVLLLPGTIVITPN